MLLTALLLTSTLYLQWGYTTMFMPICNYNLTKVMLLSSGFALLSVQFSPSFSLNGMEILFALFLFSC
jgi:hypothetical protein